MLDLSKLKAFADDKLKYDPDIDLCIGNDRKHGGKKEEILVTCNFSSFSTMLSKVLEV